MGSEIQWWHNLLHEPLFERLQYHMAKEKRGKQVSSERCEEVDQRLQTKIWPLHIATQQLSQFCQQVNEISQK